PNTGLVWGFASEAVSPGLSWDFASAQMLSVPQTTPDWPWPACGGTISNYDQYSNCFWGRNDSDWRIPTKDELTAAVANGVFTRADRSPEEGLQPYFDAAGQPTTYSTRWSSTLGKKKNVVVVGYADGGFFETGQASQLHWIPVRGPVAP